MSKRILVVEDQEDNRQILRDLLGNAGYELTEAENGEEAIAAVAKRRPDLILMDIQLPVMDKACGGRRPCTDEPIALIRDRRSPFEELPIPPPTDRKVPRPVQRGYQNPAPRILQLSNVAVQRCL